MISINIYEIIMQMVNFLILLYLLNRFLIKPLSEFIEKRSSAVSYTHLTLPTICSV